MEHYIVFVSIVTNRSNAGAFVPAALLLLLSAGCSNQNPHKAAPVDAGKARTTLTLVLDAWRDGKTPDSLQDRSPKIVVQDMDWKQGMTLKGYQVIGTGDERDANLECRVKLSLVDKQGKTVEKTVTYIVGTDPALTVFRKVFM
jgi:hypothetical protein